MKKDRDCGNTMYPVYPMPYMGTGMMPMGMPMNMGNMNQPMNTTMSTTSSYTSIDNNTLANQINALEKRVSNLEALVSNTNYNTSSYQMM